MANIYGNATDLANAQKYLSNTPGLNFIDTSKGGTYTPGQGDYVVGGAGAIGGLANAGQAQRLWGADAGATAKAIQDASGGIMRDSYANQLTNYQNSILAAQQSQKANALRSAYENNQQALNSQKGTVNNAYTSVINSINATKQAQLPQYQQQRNAASADAAQMAQKVRELMATTGRYNSGMNRSQQLAVALDRSRAIQGADAAQNNFSTQIANQLSDAENQKASSLSDIAQKLSLLSQQYNQGTLDLNNQIASEKAAAASKALLDAQSWADTQRQQGIDNSFRQGQFDYQKTLDAWNQQFQQKQYDDGLAIDLAQLAMQQQKANNVGSGRSGGSSYKQPTQTEIKQAALGDAYDWVKSLADVGYGTQDIQQTIRDNWDQFSNAGVDPAKLIDQARIIQQGTRYANGGYTPL